MADKYYIDIYKPVAGWKVVLYGPEGPEETSFAAWKTPEAAYQYALGWGVAVEIPVKPHTFGGVCPQHNEHLVDGKCDNCQQEEFHKSMEALLAKHKALKA